MSTYKNFLTLAIIVFYSAWASGNEYVNIIALESSPREDSTSLICGDWQHRSKSGNIILEKQQLASSSLGYYLNRIESDDDFVNIHNLSKISPVSKSLFELLNQSNNDYRDLYYYDWTKSKHRLKIYAFKSSQLNRENLLPFSIGLLKSNELDLERNSYFTGEMVASGEVNAYSLGKASSLSELNFSAKLGNKADAFLKLNSKSGDKLIIKVKSNRWDFFLGLDYSSDLKLIKSLNESNGDVGGDVSSIAATFQCRDKLIILKTAIYFPNERTVFITEKTLPMQPYSRIEKPQERSLFNFQNRNGAIELRPKGDAM